MLEYHRTKKKLQVIHVVLPTGTSLQGLLLLTGLASNGRLVPCRVLAPGDTSPEANGDEPRPMPWLAGCFLFGAMSALVFCPLFCRWLSSLLIRKGSFHILGTHLLLDVRTVNIFCYSADYLFIVLMVSLINRSS